MTDGMDVASLSMAEREQLAVRLLQQQIVDQRRMMHTWRDITNQPAQIDTGYIGQILVSLITGVPGGGMRGKGLDLANGSEIKTANFLDSLDARGGVSPRWNFSENSLSAIEALLSKPALFLGSIDVTSTDKVRVRVWRLIPGRHKVFARRYMEWIDNFAKPKFADPRRPYVNFQLFPPRLASDDTFARHGGGGGANRLPAIRIDLEDGVGSDKVFHAEEGATTGLIRVDRFIN